MNRIAALFGLWCLAALARALVGMNPLGFYEATIAGAIVVLVLGYRHETRNAA
jgi:hypothetical protein